VPWAETAETSHVITPAETAALLQQAQFAIEEVEDRRDFAVSYFRELLEASSGGAPPVGIQLLMSNRRAKMENMRANIEQNRISPVVMIARRR
jgi:hypothetical protein